jgi:hypothetical protein
VHVVYVVHVYVMDAYWYELRGVPGVLHFSKTTREKEIHENNPK